MPGHPRWQLLVNVEGLLPALWGVMSGSGRHAVQRLLSRCAQLLSSLLDGWRSIASAGQPAQSLTLTCNFYQRACLGALVHLLYSALLTSLTCCALQGLFTIAD